LEKETGFGARNYPVVIHVRHIARDRNGNLRLRILFAIAILVAVCFIASPAPACTLWAAAGERTEGDGTIIAKNRDWTPEADEVRLTRFRNGLRFLGLFPVRDGKRPGAVAGISERGLVVVTATAGSVPQAEREKGEPGLAARMLSEFSTVEEVLKNRELLSRGRPAIYLLADRRGIAWIEVAPGGRVAVRSTDSGSLYHTNHYLDDQLRSSNTRIGRSSAARLDRIREILETGPPRLTPEDFIAFSRDIHAGPDDSIWRTGGKVGRERTLATWIVSLQKDAPPGIFIRLANPGESEKTLRMTLDGPFWKRGNATLF
jgi:isopenicillin-N N-acyltransferase like protein